MHVRCMRKLKEKEYYIAGVNVVQAAMRGWMARRAVAQLRVKQREKVRRQHEAAGMFQAAWHRSCARHELSVRRAVRRIANAHAEVLTTALSSRFHTSVDPDPPAQRRHVFWYKSEAEVKLLMEDHHLLVERTGHMPPLRHVEQNLLEIARRVHVLESMSAVRIQAMYRGTMARVFTSLLIAERARLMASRVVYAIRIQRFFRWRRAVAVVAALRRQRRGRGKAQWYARRRKLQADAAAVAAASASSLRHYQTEVRQARSALFTGKVPYGACGGRRIQALNAVGVVDVDTHVRAHAKLAALHRARSDEVEERLVSAKRRNKALDAAKPALARLYFERASEEPPPRTAQAVALHHARVKATISARRKELDHAKLRHHFHKLLVPPRTKVSSTLALLKMKD